MGGKLQAAALLIVMTSFVACGGGGHSTSNAVPALPNNPSTLSVIPQVTSAGGVASLTLTAALDSSGRPAFFWQGSEIAPTIYVNPGDQIHLHYQNNLPYTCGLGLVSDTNLHFHGLTTSPQQPGDEVIATNAAPGSSYDYVVTIDPGQPPGLYWYHPHPHGLTNWEIGNGMAGAIVVQGIADEIPSLAGLRERVIVLRDLPYDPSVAAAETASAFQRRARISAFRSAQDEDGGSSGGGDPCSAETDKKPTINGVPTATIGIQPGERQLWRVLNASGVRHFDLTIPGQQLQLVAQDGVPIGDYSGAPSSLTVNDVVIPPAGRAEFVVTGPTAPVPLISNCYNSGPIGDPNPQVVLGELVNDDGISPTARVVKATGRVHPTAYRIPPPPPSQHRYVHFQEDSSGNFYINGLSYNPSGPSMYTVQTGTTEEWTVENDTDEVHAFHTHQVHFVVEAVNGVQNSTPHWLDTFDLPPQAHTPQGAAQPSTVKLLVDFRDSVIRGTFLFHCHITDHEDGGMMAKITAQ